MKYIVCSLGFIPLSGNALAYLEEEVIETFVMNAADYFVSMASERTT